MEQLENCSICNTKALKAPIIEINHQFGHYPCLANVYDLEYPTVPTKQITVHSYSDFETKSTQLITQYVEFPKRPFTDYFLWSLHYSILYYWNNSAKRDETLKTYLWHVNKSVKVDIKLPKVAVNEDILERFGYED